MERSIKFLGVEQVTYTLTEYEVRRACISLVEEFYSVTLSDNVAFESWHEYDDNGDGSGTLIVKLTKRYETEQDEGDKDDDS